MNSQNRKDISWGLVMLVVAQLFVAYALAFPPTLGVTAVGIPALLGPALVFVLANRTSPLPPVGAVVGTTIGSLLVLVGTIMLERLSTASIPFGIAAVIEVNASGVIGVGYLVILFFVGSSGLIFRRNYSILTNSPDGYVVE